MKKNDTRSAILLTILIVGFIVSVYTGFLDTIVVPMGFIVFTPLVFAFVFWSIFHIKKWNGDHPYIPYAGKLAHVLCRECMKDGADSRIELRVGVAFEGWSKDGRYFRGFKREFHATCSRGHSWTYDPILEKNIVKREKRAPLTQEQKDRAIARAAARSRALREGFHRMVFGPQEASDA